MTKLAPLMMSLVLALPTVVEAEPATGETTTLWSVGVAPRIGVTVPTSELGPMVVGGLGIDVPLPVADRRLILSLDVSLTRPGHVGTVMDPRIGGAGEYDVAVTELKVGLDVVYRIFGSERAFVPYAGLGPVLHMLRSTERTSFAPGDNTAQDTKLGFEVVGGADVRVGSGYVLGEVRVVYSGLDHLVTGRTNAGNVMLAGGYRIVF